MTLKGKAAHAAIMAVAMTKYYLHRLRHGDFAFFKVLNGSPLVILLAYHQKDFGPLHEAAGDRPAYFLFSLWGTVETPKAIRSLVQFRKKYEGKFPRHKYIFLCNTLEEVRLLQNEGIEAVWCNNNMWIDERIFRPEPGVEKRFDAVYDANISAYKRHALAAQVENLALISFRHPVMFNRIYAEMIRRKLDHATWINDPLAADFHMLPNQEVAHVLNQSRVGLCLSESEGAMYASIQYLLCGLPVVTTPSRGGRDVFFEDGYVLTVDPDPAAVSRGVKEMIARNPAPDLIRQKTLEKVMQHRQVLIDLLQRVFDDHDPTLDARVLWEKTFAHKLGHNFQSIRQGAEGIKHLALQPGASA